jgi:hypothetical protein
MIRPIDAAAFEVIAKRLKRPEKFSLFDSERANGELDWRAIAQAQQNFEQRQRIFAPRKRHGHAISIANHLESRDRVADFAQKCFFQFQPLIIARRRPSLHLRDRNDQAAHVRARRVAG